MIKKETKTLLNDQVNKEWASAYLYLDMANYYADKDLNGFANWFNVQAQEERDHAGLFNQYLLNNDIRPALQDVAAPTEDYADYCAPISKAFAHEQSVTASINNIYAAASADKDFRTMQFLDWFVKEQGEEEKSIQDILKRYGLFGGDAKSLYLLDSELAARVYAAPSLVL